MIDTKNYIAGVADWRKQLSINARRTRTVIILFILIYLILGLLLDTYLHLPSGYSGSYYNSMPFINNTNTMYNYSSSPILDTVYQLVTFRIIPYATITMGIVAAISLFITYAFYNKIMLMGTDYVEVTAENATTPETRQLYNVVEEMKVNIHAKNLYY
jgi:heat shock protein HtpX